MSAQAISNFFDHLDRRHKAEGVVHLNSLNEVGRDIAHRTIADHEKLKDTAYQQVMLMEDDIQQARGEAAILDRIAQLKCLLMACVVVGGILSLEFNIRRLRPSRRREESMRMEVAA